MKQFKLTLVAAFLKRHFSDDPEWKDLDRLDDIKKCFEKIYGHAESSNEDVLRVLAKHCDGIDHPDFRLHRILQDISVNKAWRCGYSYKEMPISTYGSREHLPHYDGTVAAIYVLSSGIKMLDTKYFLPELAKTYTGYVKN